MIFNFGLYRGQMPEMRFALLSPYYTRRTEFALVSWGRIARDRASAGEIEPATEHLNPVGPLIWASHPSHQQRQQRRTRGCEK